MANMLMLAQMGLAISGGVAEMQTARLNYESKQITAETEFKLKESYKKYRNTISQLEAARAENEINSNIAATHDADAEAEQDIQIQSMRDQGTANMVAGATKSKGNSVTLVMRALAASSAKAQFNKVENLKAQYLSFSKDRTNVRRDAILNKDITVNTKTIIPRPNSTAAILGIAGDILGIYDSHQAPGDTFTDRLSRMEF